MALKTKTMENKNTNPSHTRTPAPMTGKEKAKVLTSLFGVGLLTVMAYWAQNPAVPMGSENFQTNIASDNNPNLIAQVDTTDSAESSNPGVEEVILSKFEQALDAYYIDNGSYPQPDEGNYACTSDLTELKSYFPGSELPVYPSIDGPKGYNIAADDSTTPVCNAEEGFLYVTPKPTDASAFSYMLVAKVEDTETGNLPKAKIKTDGSFIAPIELETSGEYFAIISSKNTSNVAATTTTSATSSTDTTEDDLFNILGVENTANESDTTSTTSTTTSTTATATTSSTDTTDSTEAPVSRFSTLANESTDSSTSSDEVPSIDLGGSPAATTTTQEVKAAANTTTTDTKKDLPETGVPIAGYLAASLAGGYIFQRSKKK